MPTLYTMLRAKHRRDSPLESEVNRDSESPFSPPPVSPESAAAIRTSNILEGSPPTRKVLVVGAGRQYCKECVSY